MSHRSIKSHSQHPVRIALLWLAGLLLVSMLGLFAAAVFTVNSMFSHRVVRLEATPEELGLTAETIALTSSDGIPLQAWWVPAAESKGIVVLLHGMDGMDASVLLGHAQFLYDAGYSSLALDMRAHGRSGGERIGLAFEEPRDVSTALDWIAAQPELSEQPVTLLGLSMGGATAIRSAAVRSDVDAVISVSAYASVDRVLSQGMRLMGAPEEMIGIFSPFTRLAMLTLYGAWPSSASPEHDIPSIAPRPVLIAHGTADDQIPLENAIILEAAGGPTTELWIVEGAGHCIFTGNAAGPEDTAYREKILEFLGKVIG